MIQMRNRREMAEFLEKTMSHAYAQLSEKQKLEAETSMLKTYMLEAHSAGTKNSDVFELVATAFSEERLGKNASSATHKSQEDFFYNVEVRWASNHAEFYVDASDPRFWVVHSLSKSTAVDSIIRRLLLSDSRLDCAWLPGQMLERVADMGIFRGLGLDYDRRAVPDVDFDAPGAPVESLKMQLWGNRAKEILRLLSGANAFPDSTSLAKVRVKHWLDQKVQDEFSLDDVKWDGKITARGTSFQSHISLVTTVYKDYADKVRLAERRFALRYVGGDQPSLTGEPLNVTFSRPIPDLKKFVSKLFSGSEPFRLWGSAISIGDQFFRIAALDLHVAQRLTFEVAPDFMRVYLPTGSCGNTIARLFTNLQHYYDSRVQMKTGAGEMIF